MLKVGDETDVDVDSLPRVVSASGYTCPHCKEFHLVLFDEEGEPIGAFRNNDASWASLLKYIQDTLAEKYIQ